MDWVIVAATVVGPVAAVVITLIYQNRDRRYQTRLAVVTTLMRLRKHPTAGDYVGALNLVPLVFNSNKKVQAAYKELHDALHDENWQSDNQTIREKLDERANTKSAVLLGELCKAVGIKVGELDVLKGAYYPSAWDDQAAFTRQIQIDLAELVSGRRPLPVEFRAPSDPDYPRPPASSK